MIAYASSLDCVGIMSKRVDDVRQTFGKFRSCSDSQCLQAEPQALHTDVLAAFDEKDPTSAPEDARKRIEQRLERFADICSKHDLSGLRIGIPRVSHESFPEQLNYLLLA